MTDDAHWATCSRCGTTVAKLPATWSMEVGARGATWICETCTRQNVRCIEAKLDESWW